MAAPKISEADFVRLFEEIGATALAKQIGTSIRTVFSRRASLEKKLGRQLTGPEHQNQTRHGIFHIQKTSLEVEDGIVLVGGDLHAWPGAKSSAFRALVKFAREMAPAAVILNGDVIDGAGISRHPPIGWEKLPTLLEEIEVAQERLHELELAAGRKARLIWPLGNHDGRFSQRIAVQLPEYAGVHGVRLQDHFGERWEPCWSAWINSEIVVKHKPAKGGIHAAHNATVASGLTTVNNHLHSLKVTPWTDYRGTRFGVDCGCLADIYGPQFKYLEDGPRNWRSGFSVLTFRGGRLMWPELVHAIDDETVEFRGELIKV